MEHRSGFRDRRRRKDIWFKMISWFAMASWAIMFVALILYQKARPDNVTFFDRFYDVKKNTDWNPDTAFVLFLTMILGLIVSVIGLIINKKRARRKSDRFSVSLILMAVVSVMGIILYVFSGLM